LEFDLYGLCGISNEFLSPILFILKTTSGYVEKTKLAAKYGCYAAVFDIGPEVPTG